MFRLVGLAIALSVLAVVVGGCGSTTTTTVTETETVSAPAAASPSEIVHYGHISSLTPKGDHYEMRFDPAWLLSGETANTAAAEDGAVEPGQPVPNDNYVVEEGHRLLTYLVPNDAHVTVLTRSGDPADFGATSITVAELAQIVDGTSTIDLFEPLDSGVWITVKVDTVQRIAQQYRP